MAGFPVTSQPGEMRAGAGPDWNKIAPEKSLRKFNKIPQEKSPQSQSDKESQSGHVSEEEDAEPNEEDNEEQGEKKRQEPPFICRTGSSKGQSKDIKRPLEQPRH